MFCFSFFFLLLLHFLSPSLTPPFSLGDLHHPLGIDDPWPFVGLACYAFRFRHKSDVHDHRQQKHRVSGKIALPLLLHGTSFHSFLKATHPGCLAYSVLMRISTARDLSQSLKTCRCYYSFLHTLHLVLDDSV